VTSSTKAVDGTTYRLSLAEPLADIKLDASTGGISDENMRFFEEVERRNVPVLLYTSVPGSQRYSFALNSTVDSEGITGGFREYDLSSYGDPDGTYILKADAGSGYHLQSVSGDAAIFSNSIPTGKSSSAAFPFNRGFVVGPAVKNGVLNSSFSGLSGSLPYGWSGTAGGHYGTSTSSWLNDNIGSAFVDDSLAALPLEIYNTDWIDCTPNLFTTFGVGYSTDGDVKVYVEYSGGAPDEVLANHVTGTDYILETIQIPAGEVRCKLNLVLQSGHMVYWSAPFSADARHPAGSLDISGTTYIPLNDDIVGGFDLPASGGGAVVYTDLKIAPYNSDYGVATVAGYVLPRGEFVEFSADKQNVVFELQNSDNIGNQIYCGFFKVGGQDYMFVSHGGTNTMTAIDNDLGDQWFCTLSFGKESHGLDYLEARFYNLTSGVEYSAVYATPMDILQYYDQLTIGGRCACGSTFSPSNHLNGIIGGVSVGAIEESDIPTMMQRMTNADLIDLYSLTSERVFSLSLNMSPSPWERQKYKGTITLEQTGRL